MALNLTTPKTVNQVVDSLKINSFAVDIDKKEIHIVYSEMSGTTIVSEQVITIVEPDFTKTITDASVNAGTDIYTPLKASLYNQMQLATVGMTGTVV